MVPTADGLWAAPPALAPGLTGTASGIGPAAEHDLHALYIEVGIWEEANRKCTELGDGVGPAMFMLRGCHAGPMPITAFGPPVLMECPTGPRAFENHLKVLVREC